MNHRNLTHRLDRVYGSTDLHDLEAAYDQWAGDYDEDVHHLGYLLRTVSTGYIARYIPANARILDAGAGTGLIGSYLQALSYRDLTAIDLSEGMLQRARERGCYREVHQMILGEPLGFDTNSFDHGYAVGVFTEGHAPPESFDELIRVIRPGGYFVFSIRDDVYRERGYRERLDQLEHLGQWAVVTSSPVFQPYPGARPDIRSRVFVYQVAA
jgi:SAM-dependent methyltransferase